MKNANISQLQPMSISVQSGDITSAKTVSSTNKIDTPKDNPPDSAQNVATEKNAKKTKICQTLSLNEFS